MTLSAELFLESDSTRVAYWSLHVVKEKIEKYSSIGIKLKLYNYYEILKSCYRNLGKVPDRMGIMLRFMMHQEEVRHRGIGMFSFHLTLLELFFIDGWDLAHLGCTAYLFWSLSPSSFCQLLHLSVYVVSQFQDNVSPFAKDTCIIRKASINKVWSLTAQFQMSEDCLLGSQNSAIWSSVLCCTTQFPESNMVAAAMDWAGSTTGMSFPFIPHSISLWLVDTSNLLLLGTVGFYFLFAVHSTILWDIVAMNTPRSILHLACTTKIHTFKRVINMIIALWDLEKNLGTALFSILRAIFEHKVIYILLYFFGQYVIKFYFQ